MNREAVGSADQGKPLANQHSELSAVKCKGKDDLAAEGDAWRQLGVAQNTDHDDLSNRASMTTGRAE